MRSFSNPNRSAQQVVLSGGIGDAELVTDGEKQGNPSGEHGNSSNPLGEKPSDDVQAGVKKVEAITLTWTKRELYCAYFWCVTLKQHFTLDTTTEDAD